MPARVSSLFATSRKVSTHAIAPAVASFRPRVFAPPRRLTPPCRFAGLFHPAATSRVPPFRDFSRGAGITARRRDLAPSSLSATRSPVARLPRDASPTSRPCSTLRCVSTAGCLGPPPIASLFGFLLLQAFRRRPGSGSPNPPLVTFRSALFPTVADRADCRAASSAFRERRLLDSPSPESLACSRFRDFRE